MLFYGDAARSESPRDKMAWIARRLRELRDIPPGIARHGSLVAVLIEAGELLQGLADADCAACGQDAPSPATDAAMALLLEIARAVRISWDSGFHAAPPWPGPAIAALEGLPLPGRITVRRPEGFAYYALYPEAYLLAARPLAAAAGVQVIGIRSIGGTLSAMVAAALEAPAPVTLRPVGHPFQRQLSVSDALAARWLSDPACHFAVVDEGPGLSGSSFGCVADFLEDHGVASDRIAFFPSHPNPPGPQASARHRARWNRVRRHVADGDGVLLRPGAEGLQGWAAEHLGPAEAPLQEISGGAWRGLRFGDEASWPAACPQMERRKFLYRSRGGTWLLKFIGLGRHGLEQAERAARLHAAGFSPEVAGYCHGFLMERWVEDAAPLDPARCDRPALLRHLARYLGFRRRRFPAEAGEGASLSALWDMARHNAALALGDAPAAALDPWKPRLPALESQVHRVRTDNRLHAWEWLVRPDGSLLKTDAVDHAAAHDLIGCQDIAWDVAGACVELGLDAAERRQLCAGLEQEAGVAVAPELLAFLEPCYLAFQLGAYTMAIGMAGGWEREAERARHRAGWYAGKLAALLQR